MQWDHNLQYNRLYDNVWKNFSASTCIKLGKASNVEGS